MSRKLLAAVLLVVLCAAAASSAIAASVSSRTYYGDIGHPGGGLPASIGIMVQLRGKKVTKLEHIDVYYQRAKCGTKSILVSYNWPTRAKVTDHKLKAVKHFSAAQGGPSTATTTGTFSSNNKTVTGTTQIKGTFGADKGCDTGKQTYKATKH